MQQCGFVDTLCLICVLLKMCGTSQRGESHNGKWATLVKNSCCRTAVLVSSFPKQVKSVIKRKVAVIYKGSLCISCVALSIIHNRDLFWNAVMHMTATYQLLISQDDNKEWCQGQQCERFFCVTLYCNVNWLELQSDLQWAVQYKHFTQMKIRILCMWKIDCLALTKNWAELTNLLLNLLFFALIFFGKEQCSKHSAPFHFPPVKMTKCHIRCHYCSFSD